MPKLVDLPKRTNCATPTDDVTARELEITVVEARLYHVSHGYAALNRITWLTTV